MGCPCKGKRQAVTAATTPPPPSAPPGSPGKPLLWTGPPAEKPAE